MTHLLCKFGGGLTACILIASLHAQTASPSSTDTQGDATVKLPSFTVSENQDKGYLAANSVSATRISTPIADLPFAVSAFTPQFIADIGAQDIGDIVMYAAGVSNGSNGFSYQAAFYLRGFQQYPEENGFFEGQYANNYVDASAIERVEVVKGPASLLYGQIQPGGTVNYITKQPEPKRFEKINIQAGSYNFYRGTLDVNEPLIGDTLLFRFNGSVEKSFQFVHPSKEVITVLAPSLKWNITPILSAKLLYQGYKNMMDPQVFLRPQMELETPQSLVNSLYLPNHPGFSQLLNGKVGIDAAAGYPSDGSDFGFLQAYPKFPWDEGIVSNDDYEHVTQDSLNLEIDLDAGSHWKIRGNGVFDHQSLQYRQSESGRAGIAPPDSLIFTNGQWQVSPQWLALTPAQQIANGLAYAQVLNKNPGAGGIETQNGTPAPALFLGNPQYNFNKSNVQVIQGEAAGNYTFNWGTVKPLLGVYYDKSYITAGSASGPGSVAIPNHQTWDLNPSSPTYYVNHQNVSPFSVLTNVSQINNAFTSDQAAYGILNGSFFNDRVMVVGGVRYNHSQSQTVTYGVKVSQGYRATYTTPQIGVGYKLTKELMVYANYSTADQLPSSSFLTTIQTINGVVQSVPSGQAAVQAGKGYEVGVKTTLFQDRVSGYIAAYDIKESKIPQSAGVVLNGVTVNATFDDTEIDSKGVEAEFTFTPIDNWQIFVSASEDDARFTKEPLGELIFIGQGQAYATKTLANLWTRYSFQQPFFKGLWVGGGLTYHGKAFQDFANPGATWPAYKLWNASVGIDWHIHEMPVSFMLNGTNLTNVIYNVASQMRGLPRRFVGSFTAKF
jgi:iron complex outermembrane receptor protein